MRGWELLASTVGGRHVHVVVGSCGEDPGKAVGTLKSIATRRLRECGEFGQQDRIWTRHGSTAYLWHDEAVTRACRYVIEHERDLAIDGAAIGTTGLRGTVVDP